MLFIRIKERGVGGNHQGEGLTFFCISIWIFVIFCISLQKLRNFSQLKLFIVKTDWYENKKRKNRKHQKAYQKKGKYQSETSIGHQQAFERG